MGVKNVRGAQKKKQGQNVAFLVFGLSTSFTFGHHEFDGRSAIRAAIAASIVALRTGPFGVFVLIFFPIPPIPYACGLDEAAKRDSPKLVCRTRFAASSIRSYEFD